MIAEVKKKLDETPPRKLGWKSGHSHGSVETLFSSFYKAGHQRVRPIRPYFADETSVNTISAVNSKLAISENIRCSGWTRKLSPCLLRCIRVFMKASSPMAENPFRNNQCRPVQHCGRLVSPLATWTSRLVRCVRRLRRQPKSAWPSPPSAGAPFQPKPVQAR